MRNPGSGKKQKKWSIRRNSSLENMETKRFDPVKAEIQDVGNSELGDFVLPQLSSRRGSEVNSSTNYDVPYEDELEINKALNNLNKN